MNFKWRTPLGAAIAGAACMLIFNIAVIMLGPSSTTAPGLGAELISVVGDFMYWLCYPVTSLLDTAMMNGLIAPGNIPLVMVVVLTYVVILGAIAGVAVYFLAVLFQKLWRIREAWGQSRG